MTSSFVDNIKEYFYERHLFKEIRIEHLADRACFVARIEMLIHELDKIEKACDEAWERNRY